MLVACIYEPHSASHPHPHPHAHPTILTYRAWRNRVAQPSKPGCNPALRRARLRAVGPGGESKTARRAGIAAVAGAPGPDRTGRGYVVDNAPAWPRDAGALSGEAAAGRGAVVGFVEA
jgi:hypothetical protein